MGPLNPRAETLLKFLIESYVSGGQPVGSRTLARAAGLDLSPATIRNVMSDLEMLGLIRAPHTSAGRVPTDLGYRLFVDTIMSVRSLDSVAVERYKQGLSETCDPGELTATASHMLAEMSHFAGIVMMPRRENEAALKRLEFMPLSHRRILIILVNEDGEVQNRVVQADRDFSQAELDEATAVFNEAFAGMSLTEVRRQLLEEVARRGEEMERLFRAAVHMARHALAQPGAASRVVVSGEEQLIEVPELADARKLRRLFEALATRRDLLDLLDRTMGAEGVRVYIGAESGFDALAECSVIAAPYLVDGRVVGTLAVVGPTRMDYERVVSMVDVTSRLLGEALSGGRWPPPLERAG